MLIWRFVHRQRQGRGGRYKAKNCRVSGYFGSTSTIFRCQSDVLEMNVLSLPSVRSLVPVVPDLFGWAIVQVWMYGQLRHPYPPAPPHCTHYFDSPKHRHLCKQFEVWRKCLLKWTVLLLATEKLFDTLKILFRSFCLLRGTIGLCRTENGVLFSCLYLLDEGFVSCIHDILYLSVHVSFQRKKKQL